MSIRYRPDRKKWELSVKVEGKRKRLLFDKKSDATEAMKKNSFSEPELVQKDVSTIEDAIKVYYQARSANKSPRSMANEKLYFNLMFNFLVGRQGLVTLDQVEFRHMLAFQKWLSEPQVVKGHKMTWAPSTVNRAFHSIKDFFMFWVRNGNRSDSPCQHLRNLPEMESSRRPMQDFEFRLVFEASPEWFKPVVSFMHLTASAPSSVERFLWRDVDFCHGAIVITRRKGKAAQWRRSPFPMIDELRALLLEQKERFGARPDRPVFLNEHRAPLSAEWCSKVGNRAIKKAGLKGLQFYGIRHALASELTDANVNMEVIRQLMGHANIRTTQRYAKPKTGTLATALTLVRGENLPPNVPPKNEVKRLGGTGS